MLFLYPCVHDRETTWRIPGRARWGPRRRTWGQAFSRRPASRTPPTGSARCQGCRQQIAAPAAIGAPTLQLRSGDGVTPPDRRRRAGNLGGVRRSGGAEGGREQRTPRQALRGLPARWRCRAASAGWGRGIRRGRGRPARAAACRPSGQGAALPRSWHGGSVCFDRLPRCDGQQDGRLRYGTAQALAFRLTCPCPGCHGFTARAGNRTLRNCSTSSSNGRSEP